MSSAIASPAVAESSAGLLPSDWRPRLLGQISRIYSGGTPSRGNKAYWGGDIPWATTAEVDFGHIRSTKEKITKPGLENSAAKIAPPGTLLVAMYGQGKTRGKTAILDIHAAINQACAAVEPSTEISTPFLFHFLKANYNNIRGMSNAGGQENLSGEIVKKIPVVVPTRAEQDRIAEVLDDSEALIENLERLIAKKQAIKQGMMQQLLTGKTRLPGFSKTWQTIKLDKLGTFLKGRGIKRDDVRASGTACIRYGELYTTFRNYTSRVVSYVEPTVADTALPIRTGDLLFAGSGETRDEIGMCVAYVGDAAAVAGGDIVVLRGSEFNSIYLASLANTPRIAAQKARVGQGDAVVHISSTALSGVELTLPPCEEQDAIAEVIVASDRELEVLQSRLAKAKEIKQGMMQELLTGRTRLQPMAATA